MIPRIKLNSDSYSHCQYKLSLIDMNNQTLLEPVASTEELLTIAAGADELGEMVEADLYDDDDSPVHQEAMNAINASDDGKSLLSFSDEALAHAVEDGLRNIQTAMQLGTSSMITTTALLRIVAEIDRRRTEKPTFDTIPANCPHPF